MVWWHEKSARWCVEQTIARELLQDVECRIQNGIAIIVGTLDVASATGRIYETVKLKIEYPYKFPKQNQPPRVVLVSHRDVWKRGFDSHINADWSLCLFVWFESGIDFRNATSLSDLIMVIHTFLFKERVYQKALAAEKKTGVKAVWPGEARAHGLAGEIEALQAISHDSKCPCGSGKKFNRCCKPRIVRKHRSRIA